METKSESQLRQLDITELAEETREHWQNVQSKLPSDVKAEIGPCINVFTDPNYVNKFASSGSGSGRSR